MTDLQESFMAVLKNTTSVNQCLFIGCSCFVSSSYPAGDRGVTQCFAHQVSQQRVGSQEAKSDVGGLGELPQYRRVGEVHRSGPPVHQGHHDLGERQSHYQSTSRCGNINTTAGKVLQTTQGRFQQNQKEDVHVTEKTFVTCMMIILCSIVCFLLMFVKLPVPVLFQDLLPG